MATITVPNELLTTAAIERIKSVRSVLHRPYRVTDMVLGSAQKATPGSRFLIDWEIQDHSSTTQQVTGYEPIDIDVQPTMIPGVDDWFFCLSPIAISWIDATKNSGKNKQIDLWQKRVENTEKRMRKELETQLLRGTVTNMSDLITWNGSDFSTGIIEPDAVGSQGNTIHGVSKATYSNLPGMQNQVADIQGDFSANGLAALRDLHTELQEITDDATMLEGICSLEGAKNYGRSVQSQERYIDARDAVRLDVVIAGMRYKISQLMPNNGTVTGAAGDNEWSFLVVDKKTLAFHGLPGLVMDMTAARDLGGAHDVRVAFMRLAGQNGVVGGFGTLGLAYGGDTF